MREGFRQHARFQIRWNVLYGNEELVGQGTLLNVSHVGCQLAGTMPLAVGMVVKLWIAPPQKDEELCVEEARVLWARGQECGLELRRLRWKDHQWLIGYLESAERRSSFRGMRAMTTSKCDLGAMPLSLPVKD